MIKAFAQGMVEGNAEALVDLFDFIQAGRQEFLPQPAVFLVGGVQPGRLAEHGLANLRVVGGQRGPARVTLDAFDRGEQRGALALQLLQATFGLPLVLGRFLL